MKRVLIVDDSQFMREILSEILTKVGFEVIGEASNGESAIQQYTELRPDLMSMDINMPKKDGLNALKEIKKIDKNAKIVICSSIGQDCYISEAKKIGAANYIKKPFVPEKVAKVFKKLAQEC